MYLVAANDHINKRVGSGLDDVVPFLARAGIFLFTTMSKIALKFIQALFPQVPEILPGSKYGIKLTT